jgi:hypothetical protein
MSGPSEPKRRAQPYDPHPILPSVWKLLRTYQDFSALAYNLAALVRQKGSLKTQFEAPETDEDAARQEPCLETGLKLSGAFVGSKADIESDLDHFKGAIDGLCGAIEKKAETYRLRLEIMQEGDRPDTRTWSHKQRQAAAVKRARDTDDE